MRLAFFSPMPPAKSGIADYSAALLERLRERASIDVFESVPGGYEPSAYDLALYQIGNNGDHIAAYEAALARPGVLALHEGNLHHLIAELTIRRGDWDAYIREVEYDGGVEALAYARRVRSLEVGPDYEGVPMLRRVLERARGVVVHSQFMEYIVREAGFRGPVAVIPHGAATRQGDRPGNRVRLGVDLDTPLIGIFGHLKPYKRIRESLRAFRRVLARHPEARLILGGEEHPELPLAPVISSLGLDGAVRRLGFVSAEHLDGTIAACDIVVNLRHPTVGESSGTLQRALGLGKAALVSEVGSFAELPDEICLKVGVDASEEDLLVEYLDLLVSRPDLRRALGENARRWVEQECSWKTVAERYATFLEAVAAGRDWRNRPDTVTAVEPELRAAPVEPAEIARWGGERETDRAYLNIHMTRIEKTLAITPRGKVGDRVLEMGAYLQMTPALKSQLGYGEVRGCYYGKLGVVEHKAVRSADGEVFECDIDLFDAERDRFPYPDEHFSTVLCCELVEHLAADPMHMMSEINRILRPGGGLVLTTPNITSSRAIAAAMLGYHPGFFPAYIRPIEDGTDARHNREYTPREVARLLIDSGFEVTLLDTGPFRDEPKPELAWVERLLERYVLETELRGDGIYAVGRKTGPVQERYPDWLYQQ